MGKDTQKAAIDRRINREIKNLTTVLLDVPENKMTVAERLIKRAAFMRIALEDYEDDMKTNGHTEMFTQSEKTEPYERERPVVRLYNSLIRNYSTVMKQIFDLLPGKPADPVDPTYLKFFGNGKETR